MCAAELRGQLLTRLRRPIHAPVHTGAERSWSQAEPALLRPWTLTSVCSSDAAGAQRSPAAATAAFLLHVSVVTEVRPRALLLNMALSYRLNRDEPDVSSSSSSSWSDKSFDVFLRTCEHLHHDTENRTLI